MLYSRANFEHRNNTLLFRPIEKPIFMILTPIRMQRSIRFAEWLLERSINFQFFCCTSWTIYIFILNWASPKTRLVNLIEIFCIILFTIIFRLIIETCMICALSLKLLQIYLCLELAVCNRKLQNHYSILRCRIRSKFHRPILIGKILQDFILNHHWICSMIDRISPEWSGANLLFILLNIPLNMIFVNLVYFERQKTIRIVVNTCLLLIHSTVVLIAVLVLPRINRYAHRSRITILSIDSNLIIKNGLSIRYRLKTQNYVEKLSSDRFPIGIGIGSSKAVTNFDVCKFTALYIGYFLVLFDWIRTPY
ncbi:hypothetical protein SSS_01769 [Sarcoptes scabiei]|uniref:Uncharacterized protein n=1 Tax=Sarcoptes scabiei TaxID=52283 RepID=A0A834RF57_SARSC|nr:hypothetical protein SSS_01769 [Sarcoptes scabiei]